MTTHSPGVQTAIEHLRKAVNALLDIGIARLSEDERCALNWANMTLEKLTRPDVKPSPNGTNYSRPQTTSNSGFKFTVGGASPAQQVRMDKAARRYAKKAHRTGTIEY